MEREVKAAVSKVTAAYEERLSSARAEHSLKIQQGTYRKQDWKWILVLTASMLDLTVLEVDKLFWKVNPEQFIDFQDREAT